MLRHATRATTNDDVRDFIDGPASRLNWSSLDEVAHVPGDGILGCRHSLLLMGNYYTDMLKGSLPFSLVKNFPPSEMVFQIVTRLPILYLMHFLAFLHSFFDKSI